MSACAKLIDDYLDYSEYERGHRQKTITTNRYVLYRFMDFLPEDFDLRKISEKIFLEYTYHLKEKNCAETTIQHNRAVVMGLLKYLNRRGDIVDLFEPEPRKFRRKLYRVLSANEMFKLCHSADDTSTFFGIRDRTIVELAFASGVRIGELISLKVKDIHLKQGIFLIHGKGGKERYGMISDRAKYWLNRYLELRAEQNVRLDSFFFSVKQKPLDHSAMVRILSKIVKKSKLPGHITFHTIRRSVATILTENGMQLRELQEFMGHENIKTTQFYIFHSAEYLQKMYELHPRARMPLQEEPDSSEVKITEQSDQPKTVNKEIKDYQVQIESSFFQNSGSELAGSDLFKKFAPVFYDTYKTQLLGNRGGHTTSQVMYKNLKQHGLTDEEISASVEIMTSCRLMDALRTKILTSGETCTYYRFSRPKNVIIKETISYETVVEVRKKNMQRVRKGYQIKFTDELIGKIDPGNFKMPDILLALNKIYYYYGNKLLTKYECTTLTSILHEFLAEYNFTEKQSEDFIQMLIKSNILEFKRFGNTLLDKVYTLKKIKGIIIRRDKTLDVGE